MMKTLRVQEKIIACSLFADKTPAQVVCDLYHLEPAQVIASKHEPENRSWVFEIEGTVPRAGGPEQSQPMSELHFTPRQIIEAKLLAALDDADKVAVVFSKDDLDGLIEICEREPNCFNSEWQQTLIADLNKLRNAAFGQADAKF